jgi:hypothetical protein
MYACRVARWYLFKQKIPICVNFGGPWNGKGWHILWPIGILRQFCIFNGNRVTFLVVRYIFSVLVHCVKKNLATLNASRSPRPRAFFRRDLDFHICTGRPPEDNLRTHWSPRQSPVLKTKICSGTCYVSPT